MKFFGSLAARIRLKSSESWLPLWLGPPCKLTVKKSSLWKNHAVHCKLQRPIAYPVHFIFSCHSTLNLWHEASNDCFYSAVAGKKYHAMFSCCMNRTLTNILLDMYVLVVIALCNTIYFFYELVPVTYSSIPNQHIGMFINFSYKIMLLLFYTYVNWLNPIHR